jgi:hypothetical protein
MQIRSFDNNNNKKKKKKKKKKRKEKRMRNEATEILFLRSAVKIVEKKYT